MTAPLDTTDPRTSREDEWLWGWDDTPGIVSVFAHATGCAHVWRRGANGSLHHDETRFRPWLLLDRLDDLERAGARLEPAAAARDERTFHWRELEGDGALRFRVDAPDGRALASAVLRGASRRLGREVARLQELGNDAVLALPPEEQYLVASGRTYFRDLPFDALRRLQFDLETTGLDPAHDRVFLIAVRCGECEVVLEAEGHAESGEAELLQRFVTLVRAWDPDVLENHNLHGFDLPFLVQRARRAGVSLALARLDSEPLRQRVAARGESVGTDESARRVRYTMAGRELIDTMDAVRRYDFAARELGGHGLKHVARHFGIASPAREYVSGARVYETFVRDPARVRRYALDDVREVDGLARLLGGAAFALARMAPRRYERLADAGPATGVLDPLIVRAYLRSGAALPAHATGDGTVHSGAALHLFAAGMAERVVKADVASLYPSLMRTYRIGPSGDRLGVLLALVDRLVDQRLAAKARARSAPPDSPARHTDEALSAAMKIVVNSAYGYMGAVGLTRFADVHAANEVTRRGREVLALLCRELAARGVTLLEADTDGVYFSVPAQWSEADERRAVAEVGALLPARVRLEYEGRYAAMLSHEPKNYALLQHDGALVLRGVAFRSVRAEPFGERFLRDAVRCLLAGDVAGVRAAYVATHFALRKRHVPTSEVTSRMRLSKTSQQYLATRARRREIVYEAMLAAGRDAWRAGERVRVYRASGGVARLWPEIEDEASIADARDYDITHYVRILRDTFASRLSRALAPETYAAVVANPEQPSLFDASLAHERPTLTVFAPSIE